MVSRCFGMPDNQRKHFSGFAKLYRPLSQCFPSEHCLIADEELRPLSGSPYRQSDPRLKLISGDLRRPIWRSLLLEGETDAESSVAGSFSLVLAHISASERLSVKVAGILGITGMGCFKMPGELTSWFLGAASRNFPAPGFLFHPVLAKLAQVVRFREKPRLSFPPGDGGNRHCRERMTLLVWCPPGFPGGSSGR